MKNIKVDKILKSVLIFGVVLSIIIMLIGISLYFADPQESADALPMKDIIPNLASLNPIAIIDLGILILIATPAVGIISTIISSAINRDSKFVLVPILVLILLVVSFGLAVIQ